MNLTTANSHEESARRIATELDTSMFVEAGAGTGKTRNLVERIVALLARGAQPDQLVVITFTRAAAYELRTRIRERLDELSENPVGLKPGEASKVNSVLQQFDQASIETIDAFALRLLRERPLSAGLPPIFEQMDEIEADLRFAEYWTTWLAEALEDESLTAALGLAVDLGLSSPISKLKDIAAAFHDRYDQVSPTNFIRMPPPPQIAAQSWIGSEERLRFLRTHCRDDSDTLAQKLDDHIFPYVELLRESIGDAAETRALLPSAPRLARAGAKPNWQDLNDGRSAIDEARDILQALMSTAADELEAERRAALTPLLQALAGFVNHYAEQRRSAGTLEFRDLLVLACEMLGSDPKLLAHFRGRHRYVLIDEFQDTDPLQVKLVNLLTNDRLDDGALFVVGDPKQSIYRFRGADPLAAYLIHRQLDDPVRLTSNFRSHPSVIDWINQVFSAWMEETKGPDQPAYVGLHCGEPERWAASGGAHVFKLGDELEVKSVDDTRSLEAQAIAALARDIGAGRWEISNGGPNDGTRKSSYGDICVLLPTRTGLDILERALEDAHVPFSLEGQSLVLSTQEVRDLLSCLAAIDDPTDQVAVVAALRSPAFGCSEVDLYDWHSAGGNFDFMDDQSPVAMLGSKAVADAFDKIREFNQAAFGQPPTELIERFIRDRRLREMAMDSTQATDRFQRLQFVTESARTLAESGRTSLRDFIRWAEDRAEGGERMVESPLSATGGNSVRVMTVHAAKGLEFSVVIMAGLSGSPRSRSSPVLFGDAGPERHYVEVRVGPEGDSFETPGYKRSNDREKVAANAERVRLMYVAATRAKDFLIVSVFRKTGDVTSTAAKIAGFADEKPGLWARFDLTAVDRNFASHIKSTGVISPYNPDIWERERTKVLAAARSTGVVTPSAAGHYAERPPEYPNTKEPTDTAESEPSQRGRAASELGRAVHAVLQEVDLNESSNVAALSRHHAKVHTNVDALRVEALARAALGTPVMARARAAASRGRCWREVPITAPLTTAETGAGDIFSREAAPRTILVQGIIDLIFEDSDGQLVIVDYKTDEAREGAGLAEAAASYVLQLGAYAYAVEHVTRHKVGEARLIFADRADKNLEAEFSVTDLSAAVASACKAMLAGEGRIQ